MHVMGSRKCGWMMTRELLAEQKEAYVSHPGKVVG